MLKFIIKQIINTSIIAKAGTFLYRLQFLRVGMQTASSNADVWLKC